MAKSNSRGGRNNNPSGRNQYSDWGVIEMARERPFTAAATAVGAAAAGLFLWSRRTQISDQISDLSNRFGEWSDTMRSNGEGGDFSNDSDSTSASSASPSRRTSSRKNQTEIAEEAMTLKETGKATA